MGQSSSTKRKGGTKVKSVPLERDHRDRRSLPRSLRRSSDKISRSGSSSSLGRATLSQIPSGYLKSSDGDPKDFEAEKDSQQTPKSTSHFRHSTPAKIVLNQTRVMSNGTSNNGSNGSPRFNLDNMKNNEFQKCPSYPESPAKRNSGEVTPSYKPVFSPFKVLSPEDILEVTDDNYKSVRDFLMKHYSFDGNNRRSLKLFNENKELKRGTQPVLNGVRDTSTIHALMDNNSVTRRSESTGGGNSYEYNTCRSSSASVTMIREEIIELNIIESKLKSLMDSHRNSQRISGSVADYDDEAFFRVTFRSKHGTPVDQELTSTSTFCVSLQKANVLINERRQFLEKKLELESQHSKSIYHLLRGGPQMASSSSHDSSSLKSASPATLANGSLVKMRKPRALSLVESADGNLGFDGSSYRNLMQDVKDVKTLLFRLQGLLLTAESQQNTSDLQNFLQSSFCGVDPEAVLHENQELKHQIRSLEEKIEEKDETIKYLQEQLCQLRKVTPPIKTSPDNNFQRHFSFHGRSSRKSSESGSNGSGGTKSKCEACHEIQMKHRNLNTSCLRCEEFSVNCGEESEC